MLNHGRVAKVFCILSGALVGAACARTLPGTHVEVLDEGGGRTYVGGAAAPGLSNTVACELAVSQSVAAIALRFSDEHSQLGDDVAKQAGLDSGDALLQRFAKSEALNARVMDTAYDPGQHVCQALVRWKPPAFVRDALTQYVQALKERELHPGAAPPTTAGPTPRPTQAPPPAANPPLAAAAVAGPPPAAATQPLAANPPQAVANAQPAAPPCTAVKQQLEAARRGSSRAQKDLDECLRRTQNDVNICVRYKMYVDDGQKREATCAMQLADCLNNPLPSRWRAALTLALPGHAATVVQARKDGGVVLWTFNPGEATAYALELGADGHVVQRTPLAPNQILWIRQQLGV